VFYLWDFGVTEKTDKGFGQTVKWDVDLLEGYDHEFVPNVSKRPGTDWFGGLDNPDLLQRVKAFAPDAVLQFGYNYKSLVNFDLRWNTKRAPLLFRGDSHLLGESMEQGAWSMELKKWGRKLGLRLLFRRFACFLAVGKANADYFRAHGVPESKIVRCPHVVDNEFFRREPEDARGLKSQETKGLKDQGLKGLRELESRGLRAELGIPEDELVFLFAGKLEEKKQPMQLLEAFLAADLPKATLLFVGSGELESALKEKATEFSHGLKRIEEDKSERLRRSDCRGMLRAGDPGTRNAPSENTENCKLKTANCAHRVLFLPFQNQSRMPLVYRTGDVLVLPSRGRYETWGLAVNEAACCGLPAIVSSHVGCGPDLIEEGVTGWVFAAGDVEDLRRCLCEAASNRRRLGQMGSTLQRRVLGDFSYDSAARALFDALSPRTATNTCQEPCEEASAPRW
jgi:glycosyltransferase involved in cell wall biosynthesis